MNYKKPWRNKTRSTHYKKNSSTEMTGKASVVWELGATVSPPLHLRGQTTSPRPNYSGEATPLASPTCTRISRAGRRQVNLSIVACIEL